MGKIRALVVDDSAFMRKVISDILASDPDIEVIGQAKNGVECLEKVKKLNPDVVTLDIEMPLMNGLDALKRVMEEHPVPVVMLSSLTREGADATLQALEWGAVDFVTKPSGSISIDIHKVADGIIAKVKAAASANIRFHSPPPRLRWSLPTPARPAAVKPVRSQVEAKSGTFRPARQKLVVLGTSTGGPKALQTLLTSLPESFPAPIAIVQHMPPGFTRSLAQRLDSLCAIRVVEAEDGIDMHAATAYIAPGGYHLEVAQSPDGTLRTHLHQAAPRGGHRPSVDVLFESASRLTNVRIWAVVMTGMGSDGTEGLKRMKESGHVTSVVEDKSSCVVYGMPRSVIQAGLADQVVPLDKIAETLVGLVNESGVL